MIVCPKRPLPARVILALVFVGWVIPYSRAEEPAEQNPPEQLQAPQPVQDKLKTGEDAPEQPKTNQSQGAGAAGAGNTGRQQFDQAQVAAGQAAFERSCTKCHDAARSLESPEGPGGMADDGPPDGRQARRQHPRE